MHQVSLGDWLFSSFFFSFPPGLLQILSEHPSHLLIQREPQFCFSLSHFLYALKENAVLLGELLLL